jgi:hypothetical protein
MLLLLAPAFGLRGPGDNQPSITAHSIWKEIAEINILKVVALRRQSCGRAWYAALKILLVVGHAGKREPHLVDSAA